MSSAGSQQRQEYVVRGTGCSLGGICRDRKVTGSRLTGRDHAVLGLCRRIRGLASPYAAQDADPNWIFVLVQARDQGAGAGGVTLGTGQRAIFTKIGRR